MNAQKLPVLFIGHGSPMNAIEDTVHTKAWQTVGASLPRPRAILMVSAHWITQGETRVSDAEHPQMIYDMHGFPEELYRVQYRSPGSAEIAREVRALLDYEVVLDTGRGLDHGAWSVLTHLFPDHDIPVIALSIDYTKPPAWHYQLGGKLKKLRERGILIIGSGNIVHNLGMLRDGDIFPWAQAFDARVQKDILTHNHSDIMEFTHWGDIAKLSHPTHDHLLPLLVVLGSTDTDDEARILTSGFDLGSISMTSVQWG